jgi:hypothetical protein
MTCTPRAFRPVQTVPWLIGWLKMRAQSPVSVVGSVVLMAVFSAWNYYTTYAPPDTTPLHVVEGTVHSVATTWARQAHRHAADWNSPIVTIAVGDGESIRFTGESIRFTAHSRDESPVAQRVMDLQKGSALHAQADETGELWELNLIDQEVFSLTSTLARHHRLAHSRNLISGLLLFVRMILGAIGYRRMHSGYD